MFTLSHRSGASWAARTEPLLGETASQERASATALLPLRPCAAEVGERSGFPPSPRRWRWCGRKHGSPRGKKSRCVERILRLYASWQNLDRSKKRSAEVDVENRRIFPHGADDAFRHRARDRLRPHPRWTGNRHFLLGQRCPDGPRGNARSRPNPWPTESDGALERGVLKRSSSPERATTATRSSSGLGAGDEEENGGDDGRERGFSFRARNIRFNRPVPPSFRRTPIMTPAVAAALDPTRISTAPQFIFSPLSTAPTPLPLAAPCGATGGARGRNG
ncbi:hypothetical protein GWK47_048271 [Chionoecetes opilio]|uniref:Uncharacterized protein n=1 Tax=Chionoecetes opilio TaxID=41210 RepID=A0A8J5CTY9_CHIOP|nr:hypothetical protein GWK47_048271 [Chionoecetes opilio]